MAEMTKEDYIRERADQQRDIDKEYRYEIMDLNEECAKRRKEAKRKHKEQSTALQAEYAALIAAAPYAK